MDMEKFAREVGAAAIRIENTKRVNAAIKATLEVLPGYFEKTCAQRSIDTGCGSTYELPAERIAEVLLNVRDWKEYVHPEVTDGCAAFFTDSMPAGRLGIIDLARLDEEDQDEEEVILDDRKGTGTVSATVSGHRGDFQFRTVIILGQEADREVVYTFHPGPPIKPSTVQTEPGMHGRHITVREARRLGLRIAKIVG